jgi:hypothetical protein
VNETISGDRSGDRAGDLVAFFKLFSEVDRLRIAGLLAVRQRTPDELAAELRMLPGTLAHHLRLLQDAGFVAETRGGAYEFQTKTLEQIARRALADLSPHPDIAREDADSFERKVLADFSGPDGKLKSLPSQQKKLMAVLNHTSHLFEPGLRYPEKQVNVILSQLFDDTASLRRALIDYHFMERKSGIYWLVETVPRPAEDSAHG